MASYQAVCTAGFVHLVLGISLFHSQIDSCSPAPNLGGWIFVVALMLMATDIKMYPDRYTHLPYAIQFLVEVIACLAMLEFFTIVVWCSLESLIFHTARLFFLFLGMSDESFLNWEYWLLLIPTTAMAGVLLFLIKMAVIPLFDIKSVYEKHEIKVHLDRGVYMDLTSKKKQRMRRQKNFPVKSSN
ncbi:uncharacterized protein LOC108049058 [Drosophila rhopaloa]|uniref:Uncharacterized protein n=1 Tax=Drosophila rhopaloa TaxID=1041015 RepID=A0ABM5HUG4_DRORH|nr:uncharacterized protein LOC108049058 [Drosophila rhopaloa]